MTKLKRSCQNRSTYDAQLKGTMGSHPEAWLSFIMAFYGRDDQGMNTLPLEVQSLKDNVFIT